MGPQPYAVNSNLLRIKANKFENKAKESKASKENKKHWKSRVYIKQNIKNKVETELEFSHLFIPQYNNLSGTKKKRKEKKRNYNTSKCN